ncbi:hypothetical protein, partial [Campylobacter coli]|uniref:hypothetical protein n=1 Tax=Campylobacter coli TaxID=195 RepID=UPI001C2D1EED
FLRRVGEALLVGQVDDQRHEHHHDGRDERIVETAVEDIEVAVAEIVYLILFATHTFEPQRQLVPSRPPSPLVFLPISTHSTATPGIPGNRG